MAAIVVAAATVTATVVSSKANGGNSGGGGHRQQSTKSGSKDMVAVATVTERATAPETAMVTAISKMPTPTMAH
jgi:hypothetical protein